MPAVHPMAGDISVRRRCRSNHAATMRFSASSDAAIVGPSWASLSRMTIGSVTCTSHKPIEPRAFGHLAQTHKSLGSSEHSDRKANRPVSALLPAVQTIRHVDTVRHQEPGSRICIRGTTDRDSPFRHRFILDRKGTGYRRKLNELLPRVLRRDNQAPWLTAIRRTPGGWLGSSSISGGCGNCTPRLKTSHRVEKGVRTCPHR